MRDDLNLERSRALVNEYLQRVFAERQQAAARIGERYEKFWQRIATVSMVGGKRIRPHLAMIGYGATDERVVPVAAAQELIHIAMLIHDDIIDQDDMRHGVKNISGIYQEDYSQYANTQHADHHAASAAILAGDVLVSEAYRAICDAQFDDDIKRRVTEQLHMSIYEVVGGELLDVEAALITTTVFDPMQIYRYKTSSYSFIGPLLSGAYCAGVDETTIDTLRDFATNTGIAFQIQDDLLGVFGDEAETGKSTLTDLREGKRTLLARYHEELMDNDMRVRYAKFGDDHASTDELEQIKRDMEISGARQQTDADADKYFTAARDQLTQLVASPRRDALTQLLSQLEGRRK